MYKNRFCQNKNIEFRCKFEIQNKIIEIQIIIIYTKFGPSLYSNLFSGEYYLFLFSHHYADDEILVLIEIFLFFGSHCQVFILFLCNLKSYLNRLEVDFRVREKEYFMKVLPQPIEEVVGRQINDEISSFRVLMVLDFG